MKSGNLYQITCYFWYLYPSKDVAFLRKNERSVATQHEVEIKEQINYWNQQLKSNISYLAPNSLFFVLEREEKYVKVLDSDGMVGWISLQKNDPWKIWFQEVKAE